MKPKAAVWMYPKADHQLYGEMIAPAHETYADYKNVVTAAVAELERSGYVVEIVRLGVKEMLAELEKLDLENNAQNRAFIAADFAKETR